MIALNDDSIFVGQIKLLLHKFNLPLCQIGRKNPQVSLHFIDNTDMYYWDSDLEEHWVSKYLYGKDYLNITSTFNIENMIYDRKTHRYLGKYLRFIRDYNNVDLMSMYNCFDNEPIRITRKITTAENQILEFNKDDSAFITYQVPIAYGVELTLYLQSIQTFEVCLFPAPDILSTVNADNIRDTLASVTYKKIRSNTAIHYNPIEIAETYISNIEKVLSDENPNLIATKKQLFTDFLKTYYNDLYILIKIPKSTNYSMIVLEGTYEIKNKKVTKYLRYQPACDINNKEAIESAIAVRSSIKAVDSYNKEQVVKEKVEIGKDENGNTIYQNQYYYSYLADSGFNIAPLLMSYENISGNYLLADRLIEYLTLNTINPLSISAEIKRLLLALDNSREEYSSSLIFYTIAGASTVEPFYVKALENSSEEYGFYVPTALTIDSYNPPNRRYGVWDYLDQQDLRSLIAYTKLNLNYDVLGYLDKDIEDVIKGELDNAAV